MILLTTPYNPGDLDPGQSYTHAMVTEFRADILRKQFRVEVQFGTVSGSPAVFFPGKSDRILHVIKDTPRTGGTEYTDLIALTPVAGTTTYQSVAAHLYGYLITKGFYAGTVV